MAVWLLYFPWNRVPHFQHLWCSHLKRVWNLIKLRVKKPLKGTCPEVVWNIPVDYEALFSCCGVLQHKVCLITSMRTVGCSCSAMGPDVSSASEQLHLSLWLGKLPPGWLRKYEKGTYFKPVQVTSCSYSHYLLCLTHYHSTWRQRAQKT